MQLPGMSTEPVRVSLEVTFWPSDNTWTISRRAWRRDATDTWLLEEMATTGTPLRLSDALTRLEQAHEALAHEMAESDDPFGDVGPFVR